MKVAIGGGTAPIGEIRVMLAVAASGIGGVATDGGVRSLAGAVAVTAIAFDPVSQRHLEREE